MRRWRYEPGKPGSGIVVKSCLKLTAPPKFSKHKVKSLHRRLLIITQQVRREVFLQDQRDILK